MKYLFVLVWLAWSVGLCAQSDTQKVHLSLEVGTSAYSFMDGRGLKIDSRWQDVFGQKPDAPLARLNGSYGRHNIALSYEGFSHCYICPYYTTDATGYLQLPVSQDFIIGFIQARRFRSFNVAYGYEAFAKGKLAVLPYIGFYHRWSKIDDGFDAEYYIEKFIPHIGRPGSNITVYHYNHFDDWGPTAQLFIRYSILRNLTISVKGDYIRFGDSPKNQIGIGALLGFRW